MKKLLDAFTDIEILRRLFELYPGEKRNTQGYMDALKELRTIHPRKSKVVIFLENIKEDDGEEYVSVSIHDKGEVFGPALTLWSKWLGMSIQPKTLKQFPKLDILCHCLWEMTWYGYSNKETQELREEMKQEVKEIKKRIAKKKKRVN